jgi:hypothetical protein
MVARKKQTDKKPLLRRWGSLCKEHWILTAIACSLVAGLILMPVGTWWNRWTDQRQPEAKQEISQEAPAAASDSADTPIPPDDYPSVAAIPDQPSKNDVKQFASGERKRIVFRYKNTTRIPLKLLVLDWQYQFFPSKEPLAKSDGWYAWDFPATKSFVLDRDFSPGWYTFYVKRLDTGEKVYLTTRNISGSNRPAMEVTIGSGSKPFHAEFPTLGDSDVQ